MSVQNPPPLCHNCATACEAAALLLAPCRGPASPPAGVSARAGCRRARCRRLEELGQFCGAVAGECAAQVGTEASIVSTGALAMGHERDFVDEGAVGQSVDLCPPRRTSAEPSTMTKNSWPRSPCLVRTLPWGDRSLGQLRDPLEVAFRALGDERHPLEQRLERGRHTYSMRVLSSADRAVSLATTQALGSIAAGERQSRHGRLHPVWSRAPGAGPLLPGVRCARRGRRAGWGAEAGLRAVRGPRRLDRAGRLGGSGTDAGEARPLLRVHG